MSAQDYHKYIPIWLLLGISAVTAPTIAQAEVPVEGTAASVHVTTAQQSSRGLGVPSRWSFGEGHVGIEVWHISMSDFPGSERRACQEGMSSESPELGAPAQRRHHV